MCIISILWPLLLPSALPTFFVSSSSFVVPHLSCIVLCPITHFISTPSIFSFLMSFVCTRLVVVFYISLSCQHKGDIVLDRKWLAHFLFLIGFFFLISFSQIPWNLPPFDFKRSRPEQVTFPLSMSTRPIFDHATICLLSAWETSSFLLLGRAHTWIKKQYVKWYKLIGLKLFGRSHQNIIFKNFLDLFYAP